jgi:hypothetical protein
MTMSATAKHLPFSALTEAVARARTFADLAQVRRQLKELPLLPDERDVIAQAVQLREQFLIHIELS